MTATHGGRLAAKALKMARVECLFTLCGGHVMPIYDGALDEGIRIVDVRHEQAAAHAADAWARVNPGRIGVAVVTAGPGVTDAVTGVANAWRANSPILVVGGQGPFANLRRGSLQEMDHVSLMKPITKWADACYQTDRIPEYIETAIRHALAGLPGPVYLEIPMDVLMSPADLDSVRWRPIPTSLPTVGPDEAEVRKAIDLLAQSQSPMMMVGTGVKWSGAQASVLRWLEATGIPAYANGMGRGMIPHDSPYLFNRTRREAMENADCVILAGSLLDFRLAFGRGISPDAKIIQLDLDYSVMGQNRATDFALVGHLAVSLNRMLDVLREDGCSIDFREYAKSLRARETILAKKSEEDAHSSETPINPHRLCHEIAEVVDDDMIVIGDGGDIVALAAKVVPVPRRGYWLDPGPLGTLGVGMPFAVAAQIAHPDKRVVVIYGDGSFGLNGFEYDTAVRFGLPIVGIMGNDAAWGQMMRPQASMYGVERLVATKLAYTRYDRVVEALGGHGEYVTRPDEIRPAIDRAFASRKPALVNVEIKQDANYAGGIYI